MNEKYFNNYFSDIVTLTSFKVIDLTFWLKDVAFLFVPIT